MINDFQLLPHQIENAAKGVDILRRLKLLALVFECRVGKTLTALETIRLYGAKNVLFLTKKNAMSSIQSDYELLKPSYNLTAINHESMHKAEGKYDFVVVDESHSYGKFPKQSARYKAFKARFSNLPIILLSATISPESYSQLYHQFTLSAHSPFRHKNFYRWADEFVDKREKQLPHGKIVDYSRADYKRLEKIIAPYCLSYTQEEAGFVVEIDEVFCKVEMPSICKTIADRLMSQGAVRGTSGTISAGNAAALLQKVHQIHSGTIILDEDELGNRKTLTLSDAKARYIQERWPTEKLVIFYQYKGELEAIKGVLGELVTTDVPTFQSNGNRQSIALQLVSGREGINLSMGEALIFYNISHSAVTYFQARDRLTTRTRLKSSIYWLFSSFDGEEGIERKIYSAVIKKKKYTLVHFKRAYKNKLGPLFSNARKQNSVKVNKKV